ncbi:MAG: hypothetical protein QG670_630 [Thermoproteota archaeon]|nr:hypothetical protein [Thermoproteota archaeon]
MYLDLNAWEGAFPSLVANPGLNTAQIQAGFIYEIPGSWIKNPGIIEVCPNYDIHGYIDARAFANNFYPDFEITNEIRAEVILCTSYQKYNPVIASVNSWSLEDHSGHKVTFQNRIDKSTSYNTPKTMMAVNAGQTVYAYVGVRPICSAVGYGSSSGIYMSSGHSQYGFDEYVGFNGIAVKMP